jgi:hypothetical protein
MSYFQQEKRDATPATKVDLSQSAFHAVGFGFHRVNKPTILGVAQIDTHGHRLLHEVDISDPNEEIYRHSHHPISGDKYLIDIQVSHQDHNRQCSHIQVQDDGNFLSELQYKPGAFYNVLSAKKQVHKILK